LRRSFPVTAAGPFRLRTGFPILPTATSSRTPATVQYLFITHPSSLSSKHVGGTKRRVRATIDATDPAPLAATSASPPILSRTRPRGVRGSLGADPSRREDTGNGGPQRAGAGADERGAGAGAWQWEPAVLAQPRRGRFARPGCAFTRRAAKRGCPSSAPRTRQGSESPRGLGLPPDGAPRVWRIPFRRSARAGLCRTQPASGSECT